MERFENVVHQIQCSERSMEEICKLISSNVGNMAQVRAYGDRLREAGIIPALISRIQAGLKLSRELHEDEVNIFECAVKAIGALRDLGCGSAANRRAIRECWGGLESIVGFISRVHKVKWEGLNPYDLRGLTAAVGAVRNLAHSTQANCIAFHELGVTEMLSWRLLNFAESSNAVNGKIIENRTEKSLLPDARSPWREAAYRSAVSIINIAEKCKACSDFCASNALLVEILIESWGGKNKSGKAALIHPGLHSILNRKVTFDAVSEAGNRVDPTIIYLLEREETRRRNAQEAEERRKIKLLNK